MTEEPAGRPARAWWRKRRWWAGGVLWLVAYLGGVYPAHYGVARGLLPFWVLNVYTPGVYVLPMTTAPGELWADYAALGWAAGEAAELDEKLDAARGP